jgi:hypothetical protein
MGKNYPVIETQAVLNRVAVSERDAANPNFDS